MKYVIIIAIILSSCNRKNDHKILEVLETRSKINIIGNLIYNYKLKHGDYPSNLRDLDYSKFNTEKSPEDIYNGLIYHYPNNDEASDEDFVILEKRLKSGKRICLTTYFKKIDLE